MGGLFLHMSTSQISKPLPHTCIQDRYTQTGDQTYLRMGKATIRDFYAVILPSLQRLHGDLVELENTKDWNPCVEILEKKRVEGDKRLANIDLEREDECGICLEP